MNPEVTEGRVTDLDVLHWVSNQNSQTKPQNLSYAEILAFNAYLCVHKQMWAWESVYKLQT